jgi:hypothetical protein
VRKLILNPLWCIAARLFSRRNDDQSAAALGGDPRNAGPDLWIDFRPIHRVAPVLFLFDYGPLVIAS